MIASKKRRTAVAVDVVLGHRRRLSLKTAIGCLVLILFVVCVKESIGYATSNDKDQYGGDDDDNSPGIVQTAVADAASKPANSQSAVKVSTSAEKQSKVTDNDDDAYGATGDDEYEESTKDSKSVKTESDTKTVTSASLRGGSAAVTKATTETTKTTSADTISQSSVVTKTKAPKDVYAEEEEDEDEELLGSPPGKVVSQTKPTAGIMVDEQLHHPSPRADSIQTPNEVEEDKFLDTIQDLVSKTEAIKRSERDSQLRLLRLLDQQIVTDALAEAENRAGCLGRVFVNGSDMGAIVAWNSFPAESQKTFLQEISACGFGFPKYMSLGNGKECDLAKQGKQWDVWDIAKGDNKLGVSEFPLKDGAKCGTKPEWYVAIVEDADREGQLVTVTGLIVSGANKLVGFVSGTDDHVRSLAGTVLSLLWNALYVQIPVESLNVPLLILCDLTFSITKSKSMQFRSVTIRKEPDPLSKLAKRVAQELQRPPTKKWGESGKSTYTCKELGIATAPKEDDCILNRVVIAPECTAVFPQMCTAKASIPEKSSATKPRIVSTEKVEDKNLNHTATVEEMTDKNGTVTNPLKTTEPPDPYEEPEDDESVDQETETENVDEEKHEERPISPLPSKETKLVVRKVKGGCAPLLANESTLPIMEPSLDLFS